MLFVSPYANFYTWLPKVMFLMCLSGSVCPIVYAKVEREPPMDTLLTKGNYSKLEILIGPNFDVFYSPKNDQTNLLSTRPGVVPSFGLRRTWLFSERWGAYGALRVDFYRERSTTAYDSGLIGEIFEAFFEELFGPLLLVHPTVDAGVVYRMDKRRWSFQPSLGLGLGFPISRRESSKGRLDSEGKGNVVRFQQKVFPLQANMGLSVNYFISKRGYISTNIHFFQPLGRSSAELIQETDGIQVARIAHETSQVGRNFNLAVGYGFVFGR